MKYNIFVLQVFSFDITSITSIYVFLQCDEYAKYSICQ